MRKMAMKNQLWLAQRRNSRVSLTKEAAEGVRPLIMYIESVRWLQIAQAGRDRQSDQLSG